ncbi:hypothetical protein F0919_15410 [Taibaiella lutea]|uniref:Uncharacterized protein n=1 Tax=Taibaiella lutea TaxID=2608001 RepID=A0A5M6CAI4_9BACT|nr:hypothetical protein [Taibaiella lutea]KAA5532187.1 hypothetical protein F0919_15410 [Taibaiella lutea]
MQNTFSRSFRLDATTEKKFYFVPEQSKDALHYNVHINNDPELKKFVLTKGEGQWKIKEQQIKLPEWVYTLQPQFHEKIEESLDSRK